LGTMTTVWVTKSFLDYRIPVYEEVARRVHGRFVLIFNADYVPPRCCAKVEKVLGPRARGLRGERALKLGPQNGFANQGLRVPYQPRLVRTIMEEKPDALITDGFFQWTYAALWLRATKGIPHVMCYEKTAHTERNAQRYRIGYRRLCMRWIDAICCNGMLCGNYVRRLGFPQDRLTYGHMVADVAGLQRGIAGVTAEQLSGLRTRLDLKGVVFLFVGRLIPLKGVQELLTGWAQFRTQAGEQEATLLLVGDGPQRSELERYCQTQKIAGVRFAGLVDYDGLAPYYRCADAFVMPTLEDNWSLVVPEAMACGLPILCSQYNGCWPELVTPENGWVFDPLSPWATAKTLQEARLSKEKLSRMGEASGRIVSGQTASHAAEAVCEAVELACEARRGRDARD
jgi:glycosyltransferase involved in cell wall biosynthesis